MNVFRRRRFATVVLGAAVMLVGCTGGGGASPGDGGGEGEGDYVIGVSNTLTNNGWREEMICSIRAQAADSGQVSQIREFHRDTDASGQLEDLRTLIGEGVDAIIVNPVDPEAVNAALTEANAAGIPVISIDQAVTEPNAYLMSNNQEEYAYLGATWLFEAMGGSGDVVYMRGAAGAPADDDRHAGWERALEEYPDINVVFEEHTGWDQATGTQLIEDFLATGENYDGIWTSGIDNVIVDALVNAEAELVPIVGADNAGFVQQLLEVEGLTGAAVTNPASVGGAGVTLALQILGGEEPESKEVTVEPALWANDTDEGRALLEESADPDINETWPLGITIEGWTTYTKEEILDCEGP
jgi:ribose transport system substrate-binding protein